MEQYTIGLDYGTLSARAVLVNTRTGEEAASAAFDYPHGVMTDALPSGAPLPPDYALQHPQDYLDALFSLIPAVMKSGGVPPEAIAGIGVDFTASTAFPADAQGTPLCFLPAWREEKHAYVKLWKHHSAQRYADEITRIAAARGEPWLDHYGGRVSGEWSLPKLWEVLDEAPQVYAAMDAWTEAGDWIVRKLTGVACRSESIAGYKHLYSKRAGFPERAFFEALDPRLADTIAEKHAAPVRPIGTEAGELLPEMAEKLGLLPGTSVAVAAIDAHACVPGAGITAPGQLLDIIGTSACHICVSEQERPVPGICGLVEDGALPGYWSYEAGQSGVGDQFAWFCGRCVPEAYAAEAKRLGVSVQQYLTGLAEGLRPGESGLMALDWWNGNRTTLADFDLSGLLLGMNLQTRPEEIYRALLESTAYGTRMIVENFRDHGIPVSEFYASGGVSQKNPLAMQIYADVLDMPVRVVATAQGSALGSAILAAAAAGCHASALDAVRAMASPVRRVYRPDAARAAVYGRLYREYAELYRYFGLENPVMKRLKALRSEASR